PTTLKSCATDGPGKERSILHIQDVARGAAVVGGEDCLASGLHRKRLSPWLRERCEIHALACRVFTSHEHEKTVVIRQELRRAIAGLLESAVDRREQCRSAARRADAIHAFWRAKDNHTVVTPRSTRGDSVIICGFSKHDGRTAGHIDALQFAAGQECERPPIG